MNRSAGVQAKQTVVASIPVDVTTSDNPKKKCNLNSIAQTRHSGTQQQIQTTVVTDDR